MGVEAGAVGIQRSVASSARTMEDIGTRVVLLNLERLVRAIESRPWDGQDEGWWLDGHCGGRAAGIALVPCSTTGRRHLCRLGVDLKQHGVSTVCGSQKGN